MNTKISQLKNDHEEALAKSEAQNTKLRQELEETREQLETRGKNIAEMTQQLEEQKADLRTMKRKNTTKVKELTKQLQQWHRKKAAASDVMTSQQQQQQQPDVASLGSRTSSNASLDKVAIDDDLMPHTAVAGPDHFVNDRQMMIERIVR